MIRGFIFCAGKQRRFEDEKPKVLSEINGKPLLDILINKLKKYCDEVVIVCSQENRDYFCKYKENKIIQDKQFGCGYAVMESLNKYLWKDNDRCLIQWGDSFVDERIYKSLIKKEGDLVIPVRWEDNPYVKITNKKVYFSKYREVTGSGLHDLSVFVGNPVRILKSLYFLYKEHYNNGSVIHKHGNELNFLDIINETSIKYELVEFRNMYSYSFNTKQELEEICQKVNQEKKC